MLQPQRGRDIFVADGHVNNGNNRVVKFSSAGKFIKARGKTGCGPGEFRTPHAIAIDSRGRVFVGDRPNSRIQIFDQEGNHLATCTQFGRPSGIFFDENDQIYVANSESDDVRNPGWEMGSPDRGRPNRMGERLHSISVGRPARDRRERGEIRCGGSRRQPVRRGAPPRKLRKHVRVRP